MPPCLHWTLSALRYCPITSLSLSQISLEKELWGAALTLIAKAAPNLTDLFLSELESISDVEILKFLSRLPRLTSLRIGNNEEARGTPTKCANGTVPEFRNLASLVAPANFVLYFLRPRPCFPKLKSLCIAFHAQRDIRTIAARLSAVCPALTARTIAPSLSLSLALFSDSITADLTTALKLPEDYKKYFNHVASLDLHVFPYDTAAIARWVHLFPSVQHVSMTVRSKPADMDADAARLVKALYKEKSILRTATINGTKHALNDITRSATKVS